MFKPETMPAEVMKGYRDARFQSEVGRRLMDTLTVSVTHLIDLRAERGRALTQAQEQASRDYIAAQLRFAKIKRLLTFVLAGLGIITFGLAAFVLVWLLTAMTKVRVKKGYVFGGAAGLLTVLVAYELCDLLGAVVASILFLFLVLVILLLTRGGLGHGVEETQS
jgi:hypothetical protein